MDKSTFKDRVYLYILMRYASKVYTNISCDAGANPEKTGDCNEDGKKSKCVGEGRA